MKRMLIYGIAVIAWLALAAAGVARWHAALAIAPVKPLVIAPARALPNDSAAQFLEADEDAIVTNDPFRLSNEPALAAFDPDVGDGGPSALASAPQPRPILTLKAIVGGPPWQAVVDGLPGQLPNTVVQSGSVFDKLVARAVTRDSVVIQGPDTTWILSFRRPE